MVASNIPGTCNNIIGLSTDQNVALYDLSDGADAEYIWYMKPEDVQIIVQYPDTFKYVIEEDHNVTEQYGKQICTIILKNILIHDIAGSNAFAQYQLLRAALMYWASTGTPTTGVGNASGGHLLWLEGKDVNGNFYSELTSFALTKTFAHMRTKIIDPLTITPQPNGDYLIRELRVSSWLDPTG